MTDGPAVDARARWAVGSRVAVWSYAIVVGVVAFVLFCLQLVSIAQPCVVPQCVWPELSQQGFDDLAALGIPPWIWVAFASAASLIWWIVPFAFGLMFAADHRVPAGVAVLWFTFSLWTLSAAPSDPVVLMVLRTLTLGAWFTLFATFPTGRFVPRWVAAAPVLAVAWSIVLLTPAAEAAQAANDPLWWTLISAVYVACIAVIIAAQIVQFRRGDADERRSVRLLLVAFVPFLALGVFTIFLNASLDATAFGYGTFGGALLYQASAFLTVVLVGCIGVAALRHRAYGVRLALDRVLVGTVTLAFAATIYVSVVLIASLVAPVGLAQGVATVTTAVVLAGTYARIARGMGRLVHGDADDPSAVADALAHRVAEATSPEELGPRIAAELAERLRFPGVTIHAEHAPAVRGEAGRPGGRRTALDLTFDGQTVGHVDVTLRLGQTRLSSRDRTALGAASGPLATAVTAYRMSDEVRRSRFAVVAGRDEERRMLRRQLHDEIGPTLALAGHRIAASRDDPSQLDGAARTVEDAVAQVRAISRELRPPALDEWGLRAALAAFAGGLALPTTVTAPERVEPSVVEVAVYRITVEALLNAARHAHARRADISVRMTDGGLILDVDDDGTGMGPDSEPGVGTLSMRERAAELGGSLTIVRSPLGGVRVHAELPTGAESIL